MNILIPMAGEGSRFRDKGYIFPKPFIEVNGEPMIATVIKNLNMPDARHIFLARRSHIEQYSLEEVISQHVHKYVIIPVDEKTEGAACTALLAEDEIDNNEELLIANSDQYIEWESKNFNYVRINENLDGAILCFESTHPKWSYVRLRQDLIFIDEVKEKVPISNIATCGIYYFKRGFDFVKSAKQMIAANDRFNGEFYIAPVFNYLIKRGYDFVPFYVSKMHGLGTPEDLEEFLRR